MGAQQHRTLELQEQDAPGTPPAGWVRLYAKADGRAYVKGDAGVEFDLALPHKFVKEPVRAATTAALPANTYANGTAGEGATLTANANGALAAQDTVSLAVGERLLVKHEAAPANNGIYTVTQLGTGALPYILTRSLGFDLAAKMDAGTEVYVQLGAANVDTVWRLTTTGAITIGTTGLTFSAAGQARVIRKPSDTSRNTTTARTDDPHLLVPICAGELLLYDFSVVVSGNTTADINLEVVGPAGATIKNQFTGYDIAVTGSPASIHSLSQTASFAQALLTSQDHAVHVWGTILNGTTAGNLALKWAQNVSNAGNSTIEAGSSLLVVRG